MEFSDNDLGDDPGSHNSTGRPVTLSIMDDFGAPMVTDEHGIEYRMRKSTRSVFTYRPTEEQWLYLCTEQSWPEVALKLGFRVKKKITKRKKPESK